MNILVTGATGTIGNLVMQKLFYAGENVAVLVRNISAANIPATIHKIHGNLADANSFSDSLKGIDCLFLLLTPDGDPAIITKAEKAGIHKIVAISDGTKYPIEDALYDSDLDWIMLHPVEFMKNTLMFWKDSIKYKGIAKTPFPDSPGVLIHEEDIADVAVKVLLENGHTGKSYYLTGPEVTTPKMRAKIISEVTNKPIQLIVQSESETRKDYAKWGMSDDLINYAIESAKKPEKYMYTVLDTVQQITGNPARTFRQWATEHLSDFIITA